MVSLETIIGVLGQITETVVIDGVAGFVPILAAARVLMMHGALKDTGCGAPTSRQLANLRREAARFPDNIELRICKDGVYLRLL